MNIGNESVHEQRRLIMKRRKREDRKQFVRVFFGRGVITRAAFIIVLFFLFLAVACPILTPYTPYEQTLTDALQGPSGAHWLGTDNLGRDLFTRIAYGARISLVTGLLSSLWAMIIGVALGLVAGYFGGILGGFIMRMVDAQLSLPPLILTMCLAAIFGGNIFTMSLIIGIASIPGFVRMIYGQVLSLREQDFITAANLVGESSLKILLKHLAPNCFPTIIVMFTVGVGQAVMVEAGLAYLGIGIAAPTPAWGVMISEGYRFLALSPGMALWPGVFLILLVISLSLAGDGLRDALDPKLRGKL